MKLKDYQEDAVQGLLQKGGALLQRSGPKRMIFKAPTGSGKTVVMAEFLKRLTEDRQVQPFACIWAAPRKLHSQSREKLRRYYADSQALDCVEFDGLLDKQIGERQILFLNWESIRQENNIIIRENEREMYLAKVLENTHAAGRRIILLIDESHYHLTEISNDLIADIAPQLIVEISATPVLKSTDEMVTVDAEDVKAEGMIKQSVIINPGFVNSLHQAKIRTALGEQSEKVVLKLALDKRRQLADALRANGSTVNPLLCIQMPDKKTGQDTGLRETVEASLRERDVTVQNGKFAVWLSGEHKNTENLSANDCEAEVLLFKQAIALGWDCPRAQILVLFRHWHNNTFSVQTLGRIMRMPEPEIGHYADGRLNNGYVFTNLPQVEIHEDVARGYVHIFTSQRRNDYTPLQLRSVHRLRQREQTRIAPRFSALFLKAAEEMELKRKITTADQQISAKYINDYKLQSIDGAHEPVEGTHQMVVDSDAELQKLFDHFVRANLDPYYPEDRAVGNVKKAIYDFFAGPLFMDFGEEFRSIINIVLSDNNRRHFVEALARAKTKYRAETEARKVPLQVTPEWEVPASITFGDQHREREAAKSVMQPFYAGKLSQPEERFIAFLEGDENVQWWYKNGESESKYFAVPYRKNSDEAPFYVDFIVRLKDGRTALFDTKSGFTIGEAAGKSDGLIAYVAAANRTHPRRPLLGGIVTTESDGKAWKIYRGRGEDLQSTDLSNWDWLDLSEK